MFGLSFKVGPTLGMMIVAGDGNAYLLYSYFNSTAGSSVTYIMLLSVSPDGSFAKVQLDMGTYNFTSAPPNCTASGSFLSPWSIPGVITNAGTGVAVFASVYQFPGGDCSSGATPAYSLQVSYVSQDSVTSQMTAGVNAFVPALQREDGSYIGTYPDETT